MRLAYLCNLYPAVSHSFVRREIEAVERANHEVHRFSVRPPRSELKDPADRREAQRTEVVLGQGVFRLVVAAVVLLVARPVRTVHAIAAAARLSGPGLRGKVRHTAYWLEAAWLVRRLDRLGVEHLHAHFGTNPAAVATIVRAWGGPPFSFTVHGPDEFDAPTALSLRRKIEAASFVAAISSYGRSQLMRWSTPEHWTKIGIVRCGVDDDFLNASAKPVPAKSTEFVCVARLSAQKGLPLLIVACERLRAQGEKFSLTIIGDGEMRDEIKAEIARRKLGKVVKLAGICTSSEIRDHVERCRAFVLPSFAEGLPVVIMEALALGRPVITTAVAGIPELVDNSCGWLIPAGSEDALVEAMEAALRAPAKELWAKGAVGRERVRKFHDAGENSRLLVEAIARSH
ncbi:MAG: glycosyltransferase [Sphingomonas sp.]|nr:glycosyltransferase [Sphingomonas sp.]